MFNSSVSDVKFMHYLFLALISVQTGQKIFSLESVFPMSGNQCISTTVSVGFSAEVFGELSKT